MRQRLSGPWMVINRRMRKRRLQSLPAWRASRQRLEPSLTMICERCALVVIARTNLVWDVSCT